MVIFWNDYVPGRMRTLWEWLKRSAVFGLRNADAFLAMGVAVGVLVSEVTGNPSQSVVNAAVLTLLGTVAFSLLRNRGGEQKLDDLRKLALDAVSDRPYVVGWQDNHWDLKSKQTARVISTEQIRFTRQEVSENWLWSNGPGTVQKVSAKWRRSRSDPWIEAEPIHQFAARGGVKEIFCFNEEHNRGDVLDWCVEREIDGQFPDTNEAVEIEAATKSSHPRALRITWPRDAPPTRVEIREGDRSARPLRPTMKNGRPHVEEKIYGLKIGEKVRIDWTW